MVHSTTYDPYGGPQKTWIKTYEPKLKFSGKEREIASELDYFGARYYDHIGYRFISSDPITKIEEAISSPQKWNLYSYCHNNPLSFFDPDGRSARDVAKILKTFWESVEQMNDEYKRLNLPRYLLPGVISNFFKTFFEKIFGLDTCWLGCGGQAEISRYLLEQNHYDDKWTFELEDVEIIEGVPTHTRGRAHSSNPNDPDIIFDPWKGTVEFEFKGENSWEKLKNYYESNKNRKTDSGGKDNEKKDK